MRAPAIPIGAHKAAHYFYGGGKQIQVFHHKRRQFIRDETGDWPVSPVTGLRDPHPNEGSDPGDDSYDCLGLYYDYLMPHSGWSGDC